ncbi:Proteinase inhibitor I13 potato inhibitor I protein [Dioscorea alata]|uniref:Proteinase inhibitor I13 potato inhibitor I protein n=1 Tax=Dioscorea alata TaxID=55571 RepID=A0ACB7UXP6_DIOAL|nr:Proteinase inhibitor I13 potato inhibitor I protein [Dioscorea alata]
MSCAGKSCWPELLGVKGEKAVTTIEEDNDQVKAIIVEDGSVVTKDFRCDRVWVWVNKEGVVIQVPKIG